MPLEKKPSVRQYISVGRNIINVLLSNKRESGRINTGMLYIMVIMFILMSVAYLVTGPTPTQSGIQKGTQVEIKDATSEEAKDRLQLYSFGAATITPPSSQLCSSSSPGNANIIVETYPKHAEAVSSDDQIKIWVNDDLPPKISLNEKITRNSGSIITPGDRAAKAPDGYPIEPALYIFPQTAEGGGQPFYPSAIRGDYDSGGVKLAFGIEQLPPTTTLKGKYTAQFIWSIPDLGLKTGSYRLQFLVLGGGDKRAAKCINIRIYERPDKRWVIPD